MQRQHMDFSLQRKDSYESTSSSLESPFFANLEDVTNNQLFSMNKMIIQSHKKHDVKNYPKISLESQAQMRKSVKKINNLRFLGILRVKDEYTEAVDDVEMFKKIFKVTQKGLLFDQNQYFLQLNAAVMNNHLHRQVSPYERLKVNLYDDEKPNSQFLNIPTEQSHQTLQQKHSTSLLNATPQITPQQPPSSTKLIKPAKKATIRRRSCYCPLTGIQSKKGQRMDYLFPASLIKNRIFMKMKRKQELKVKDLTDKDLIISNLNKTFDLQDKTSARKMKSPNPTINPDQMPNIFNFIESTSPQQGKRTSITGKINTGSSSSKSQLQQGLSQSKSQFFQIPSSPKNTNIPGVSLSDQIASIQDKNRKSKVQIDQQQLNSPNLSNKATADFSEMILTSSPQKVGTLKNIHSGYSSPQVQANKKSKMYQGNAFQRINQQDGGNSFSSHHDGSNNRKILGYSSFHGSPDSKNAISHGNNNNNNISTFKKAYIQDSGNNGNNRQSQLFGSSKKKEDTYVSINNGLENQTQPRNSVEAIFPGFFDKRKKLIAKLRVASKLVGIQEKQRKKSLLYHQEYYNALQNMDSNNIDGDSDRDKQIEEDNGLQIEKKNIFVKKVKTDEENDIFNAQIISQQIIDSHNLRFNSTLNSFIDQRAKSQNCLLSNQIIMEEKNIAPRRTPEKINKKYLKSSESSRMLLSGKKHKGNSKDTFSMDSPFLIQIPSPIQKKNPMLMKSHHQHSKSHQLCSSYPEKDPISHQMPFESTTPFLQSQQQSLVSLPCMNSQSQCSLVDINFSQDKVSTKLGSNQNKRIKSVDKATKFEKYLNSTGLIQGNTKQKSFHQFKFNYSMHNAPKAWNGSSHSPNRSLMVKNSQQLNNFLNKYEKSPPSTAFSSSSSGNKSRTMKSYKKLHQVIPQPNVKQAITQSYLPSNQPLQKSNDIQKQSNAF